MRYFIFYYNWSDLLGPKFGWGNVFVKSECFPSQRDIKDKAEEMCGHKEFPPAYKTDIVLTGWNEFKSKEDYEAFMS